MKKKVRLYALFQWFSLISTIFLVLSLSLGIMYFEKKYGKLERENLEKFLNNLMKAGEHQSRIEIISTTSIYLFIVLYITSCIWGWIIFVTPDRNYYDELFLMFLFIPIASNIFALMAQLSFKISHYGSKNISSKELKIALDEIKKELRNSENFKKYL